MKIHRLFISLFTLCATLSAAQPPEPVHKQSMLAQTRKYEYMNELYGVFLEDSLLLTYLDSIALKLTPQTGAQPHIRIRIMKSPSFNAFATPHGTIYLCTGILARIKNEAQLAALISHEMVHVINNHSIKNLSNAKKNALSSTHLRMGLDFFIGSLAGTIGSAVLRSAITGYTRDLEREADSLGLQIMTSAGYAPIEFRNLFLLLKSYIEEEAIKEPFFFATHPAIKERISNYYAIFGQDTVTARQGFIKEEIFTRLIRNVLITDAQMSIATGKTDNARRALDRVLATDSCDTDALTLYGNTERLSHMADTSSIKTSSHRWYRKALGCDHYAEALLQLGFSHFKNRNLDSASICFKNYMSQSPDAPCIPLIRKYLQQCEN